MDIDIYRGESVNLTKRIDDNTRLIRQLLGADIIKSTFNSRSILDIDIGDYIVYNSINYYVNSLPNVKKNATNSFDYTITFESEYYELLKTQFLDTDGNSDFSLMGNLETFIDLIVINMNREHSGWAKGACNQTNSDYKLLNFSKFNCMQVLQKLCVEFEGEFYFDGKDICFTDKAGSDSGLTFRYKQGLRNIQRTTLSEKNIITRLYAFGSRKNLASDYRSHTRRLKFVADGESYLESNIDKYGTIEHTELFNSIYPHRDGTISAVDGADITKFTDSGMDFNLNDHLLPGITAKLHFNSGNLGGYEFEVSAYNNSTKEFTIIKFKDEQGYEMPNATLKPAVGDKYVLLDIEMPQSYIDTAETVLQAKAQTYLDDNDDPRVTYILTPDPRYFKTHLISLEAGDFITIEDTDLEINVLTRIVELTKSVADQYKYTLKLTDHLEVQLIQRLYSEQEDIKQKIEIDDGGDIIRARRNWKTSEELRTMIFDTDGYFDMGNIRPVSIETSMLSVGTKSTQYILKEIQIEGNYTGDVSLFHASEGELIHLSIADEIRTWTISANDQDSLTDGTAYYIYAKCTKEPGYTGQIVVDDTQRKFDDDETYYYFLIGVLHSVFEGVRGISLTYGQTIINGKFITTGSITADQIAANAITADKINANAVTTVKLDANAITAVKIAADAIETDKLILNAVTADKIAANAIETAKIKASAVTADKIVSNAITAIKIIANAVETGKIKAGAVTADKIATNAITAIKIAANAIETGKIKADAVTADKIDVSTLSAIAANIGAITAGTIRGVRLTIGGGTDEDIYFEDSGIRLYDAGSNYICLYKAGNAILYFVLGASGNVIQTTQNYLYIMAGTKTYQFRSTGVMALPILTSEPTVVVGAVVIEDSGAGDVNNRFHYYTTNAGWQYFDDNDGW